MKEKPERNRLYLNIRGRAFAIREVYYPETCFVNYGLGGGAGSDSSGD